MVQPKLNNAIFKWNSGSMVWYFLCCYLIDFVLVLNFSSYEETATLRGWVFIAMLSFTYPFIYLMPLVLLAVGINQITKSFPVLRRIDYLFTIILVCLTATLTVTLYTDVHLYDLYGFHINAFVINLIVTPGGIESMGGGSDVYISAALATVAIFALHFATLVVASVLQHRLRFRKDVLITALTVFIFLTLSERVVYGVSDIDQHSPVLQAASTIPLYNHVTFRSLAKNFGIQPAPRSNIKLEEATRELRYPKQAIHSVIPEKPLNIIWLVSESMRWDMLSPEIMPNTYSESERGRRYTRHYSGGNGTRQGLFSLFYGIYGSYWDSFLSANRTPVLMDILQERGYQLEMFTSADFTYPEFDRTLFASLPQSQLHQLGNEYPAWKRDEINTAHINQFLQDRDKTKPFMVFMFYESTHARYNFPAEKALRKPYLEDLNYATMTRKSLAPRIGELKNRYINASHFIDSELAKIYTTLSEQDLWKDTIVMVTGDHGEEFMENGFWGHNSGFSEQQIRTPMVLWIPDEKPMVVNTATSHMDIIPTILPLMGVNNPVSGYSLGQSMVNTGERHNIIVSDWAGVAYVGEDYKFTMPFNSSLSATNQLFTREDEPATDIVSFLSIHKGDLDLILTNSRQFTVN